MSALGWITALVKRVSEFVAEIGVTFVERAVEAVKGLLKLDWKGEPVAAASVVVVALVQAWPSLSDVSLSLADRIVSAVSVFALAVAASTRTRAKSVLPKKYQES